MIYANSGAGLPYGTGPQTGIPFPEKGAEIPYAQPQGVVQRAATLVPVPPPSPAPQAAPQQSVVSRGQRLMAMGLVSPQGLAISEATGLDPLTAESHIRRTPGQAAITREQLLASNEQAVAMKQARQEVSRNAWDQPDLDEKEARDLLALETRQEAEGAKAQGALDVAAAQEAEMARQYGTSKEEIEAWEAKLTGEEKQLIGELDDIANQKADPTRLFVQRGAIGTALSTIGDALTTYAEFRAGRPLTRQLQQDIDRDIALQEQEIARKGEGKRTELAQLSRQFGSLEAGKAALRAKQEAYAATQLARASLVAEEPAIRAEMEAASQEFWNRAQDQLVLLRMGDRTVSESSAYASPRAGSRGGISIDTKGLADDVAKAGTSGLDAKTVYGSLAELAQARADADSVLMTIDQIAAENGLPRDPKTGELRPSPNGISGFGFVDSRLGGADTEAGKRNKQRAISVVMGKVKSAFGAANEKQVEMIEQQLMGSKTEQDFIVALNEAERMATNEAAQRNAGRPQEVVGMYERNLADQRAELRNRFVTKAKLNELPEANR